MNEPRTHRIYNTAGAVVAFARQNVPITVISRALVTAESQVYAICRRGIATGEMLVMPPAEPATTRDALQIECAKLREDLLEARALLREIQDARQNDFANYVGVAKLTVHEAKMVALLVRVGRASKDRIYAELYADDYDHAPEPKIVDVFLCKVRRKLTPEGIEIGTVWGYGYEMTRENIARLRDLASVPPLPRVPSPGLMATQNEMAAI